MLGAGLVRGFVCSCNPKVSHQKMCYRGLNAAIGSRSLVCAFPSSYSVSLAATESECSAFFLLRHYWGRERAESGVHDGSHTAPIKSTSSLSFERDKIFHDII